MARSLQCDITSIFAGSDEVLMINPTTYFLIPTEEKLFKNELFYKLKHHFGVNICLTFTLISGENLPACLDDSL